MDALASPRVSSAEVALKPVAILAVGAESSLGVGPAAYSVGALGARPVTAIAKDPQLERAGLAKPFVARASAPPDGELDAAAWLVARAARALASELDAARPAWRDARVGVVVGTSSGGMIPLTEALASRSRGTPISAPLARAAPYFGPLAALDAGLGVGGAERVQVLAACASSAIAIGLGCRWLELGLVDLVIAGGYDAVSDFVAAGFESLGATSATRPAPFRVGRDGMALGEAAVLLALGTPIEGRRAFGYVTGFGASCDAVHVTAPDRSGAGLARAAHAALADAGLTATAIDLVSAHATATPFNDAAEARALATILGERVRDVVVHPFKAVVGHTLGASSALESAAALAAMSRDVLPSAPGEGDVDPDAAVRLLPANAPGTSRHCLKLSAAFGGANAALIVSTTPTRGVPLPVSGVELATLGEPKTAADAVALGDGTRLPRLQLSRMDALSAATVAATASALGRVPGLPLGRTGVVVGTATATIENDEAFDRRLREKGASGVEPRRFPPTSPNLPAGQCAIAFGLLGPALSVGAGPEAPLEALLVAMDLLAAGDADALVVVAAESVGDVVRELWSAAGWPVPADGAVAAVLRRSASGGLSRERVRGLLDAAREGSGEALGAGAGWPLLGAAFLALGATSHPGGE